MDNLHVISHPLIQHKISLLRDVNTGTKEFRELVSETSALICYEALRDLPIKEVNIETPLGIAKSGVLSGTKLAVVPMLRGGLGMVEGISGLIPAAKIGHIGTFRDPAGGNAVDYYCKLPVDISERDVILADIMLATGVTAVKAVELCRKAGARSVKFICIIANPMGIDNIIKSYPDVEIYCGAVDEGLSEQHYIIPGLGDAGYRMFGTK